MKPSVFIGTAFLLCAATAQSAIITGVKARASSEFGGRPAINAVNGSGLVGDQHGDSFGDMWLSANNDTAGTFEVDLGAVYDLTSVKVWNYNETGAFASRGVMTANLDVATSLGSYTTHAADRALAIAPGAPGATGETIDLTGVTARFVRLDISANHGDAGFTGLSELQFDGTLVPGQDMPIPISGVIASSEFPGREAIHTIDGSGLFGPTHTIVPGGNMWLTQMSTPAPDITFDLGSSQVLGSIKVWNYNEVLPDDPSRDAELLGRGVNEVEILTSDDGVDFTSAKTHNFALAPGSATLEFAETVPLEVTAQFVKLDVKSNHGNFEGFTGISEVQFFAPSTDSDADMLPDPWEELFFPGDLTQLTGLKNGPGPGADTGDFDGDGVSDADENQMGLIPTDDDTDDDMLLDGEEIAGAESRPPTNPKSGDTDGDMLTDLAETNTGVFINADDTGTDPTKADTDGDSFGDKDEIDGGTDPNNGDDFPLATLVGYWPFDEDVDPQPDLSGFANDAAVDGAGTWANDATRDSGVMQFVSGPGLQAAHSDSLNIEGAITIAAWVKPNAGAWEGIVAKSPLGPMLNFPGNYELRLHTTGRHLEMLWEPVADVLTAVADVGNGVTDSEWTHVAFAGTPGGFYNFYINGAATGTGLMPDDFTGQNTNPLYIGSRADAFTGFDGCLDDIAIFAGQVPPQQIMDIMGGDFSAFGIGSADFRITSVIKGTAVVGENEVPAVTITFNSRPGRKYSVWASTSLKETGQPGGWIELDDTVDSQGEETTYTDTLVAGGQRVFYQVREN